MLRKNTTSKYTWQYADQTKKTDRVWTFNGIMEIYSTLLITFTWICFYRGVKYNEFVISNRLGCTSVDIEFLTADQLF